MLNMLAINGGSRYITKAFKPSNPIGVEEINAVVDVMGTGVLSKFLGAWSDDFYGGNKVLEFEAAVAKYFNVDHAITVNSWTSGLIAAVGALDISPGDEVIVSPWTMSASAMAILHWNAIPIFVDVDPRTYNIDASKIEEKITAHTRAIIVPDIFGMSADVDAIMRIAATYGLKVISDTAQAPGALYRGKYAGTCTDIGGFSLNYHKHIHTGEGGVLVTNDSNLAERMRLIRNHAESVVAGRPGYELNNMIGHNFRMGEIEAAIGVQQLKKLDSIVKKKQILAEKLFKALNGLAGLELPYIPDDFTHVFYIFPMQLNVANGPSKKMICEALLAEGVPISSAYQNIHLLPVFQKKIAYGRKNFPWDLRVGGASLFDYAKGICPVAEDLQEHKYMGIGLCNYDFEESDMEIIAGAFWKVWAHFFK